MVDSLPEADRTPTTVGTPESAGGRSAWSREGMTSSSNDTRNFSSRCLLLALVVGVRVRRIHALVYRHDDKLNAGLPRLRRFLLFLNDSQPSVQRQK